MTDSTTKICTKCGKEYPATCEFFYSHSQTKDRLHTSCKSCRRKEQNVYIKENPDKKKSQDRAYYLKTQEKQIKYGKQYRETHKEECKITSCKYYLKNKYKILLKQREYNKVHKEEKKKYDQIRLLTYPEIYRNKSRNRKARLKTAKGSHTAADIQKQFHQQKGKCYYCDHKLKKKYHVDHVIPLAKGGSNDPSNLVCACARCNLSKKDKTLREWIEIIQDTTLYLRITQRIIERELLLRNLLSSSG